MGIRNCLGIGQSPYSIAGSNPATATFYYYTIYTLHENCQ